VRRPRWPTPGITGPSLIDAALAGDAALWWANCKQLVLPLATTPGMVFGAMLGSSVVVDQVFGWPARWRCSPGS